MSKENISELKKRREPRLPKNLLAYSDDDDYNLLGVIGNVSKNGIFIESEKPLTFGDQISFVLAITNEIYRLKGEVKWMRKPDESSNHLYPAGIGIRITEAPAEFLNYVEYLKYETSHLFPSDD